MYSSSMKVGLRLPQTEKHRATKEKIINLAKGAENAKIFNIAGDCLIYYFPKTSDASNNQATLKDVLECGITLTAAHRAINAKLHEEKLAPVNYRISAKV